MFKDWLKKQFSLSSFRHQRRPSGVPSKLSLIGLGKERQAIIENLAVYISSGMDLFSAIDSLQAEAHAKQLSMLLGNLRNEVEEGSPFWKALERTGLFSRANISLVRIGEETGRLEENLKMIVQHIQKDALFKSQLRTALMYPTIVVILTLVIGIGIAWFILPNLANVFSSVGVELPTITKILIGFGLYLQSNGFWVVPLMFLGLIILVYFMFIFSKTKFIGDYLKLRIPIIGKLIRSVQISRFGFILGNLLEVGVPVKIAFQSLCDSTEVSEYRHLYTHVAEHVLNGDSVRQSIASFPRSAHYIPLSVQNLIAAAERASSLPQTLVKISETYEQKSEETTKNLMVLLEPILMIFIWAGVVGLAIAVILPVYSLIGNLNTGT